MKRLFTLMLVLAMICLAFAGCGSGNAQNGAVTSTDTQNEAASTADTVDTNIHIDWTTASMLNSVEMFNLSVASGDYPDMYMTAGNHADYYIGGLDKFIDSDVIYDLSELIPEYAPNYNYRRTRDPMVEKLTMTDSGNVPYFQTICETRQDSYQGGMLRQDLLDATDSGIQASDIQTYDDLHDALVALKDAANKQPLLLGSDNGMATFFMVGYGVTDDFYNDNGTAVFGPAQEGFKKYLKTMNQWYEEGLVDKDFISHNDFFGNMSMTMASDFVVSEDVAINMETYEAASPGQQWEAFHVPMEHAGDIRTMAYSDIPANPLGGGTITISTACDTPDILCQWIDLGYSKDLSVLFAWGIEGLSYVIGADGKPEWTELVYKNEGLSFRNSRSWYSIGAFVAHLYDYSWDYTPETPDKVKTAGLIWDTDYEDTMTMPTLSMDERDASEYASVMGDITTSLEEYTSKFIMGEYDIDAQWDTYLNALETAGLPRATELEQAALESFLNR